MPEISYQFLIILIIWLTTHSCYSSPVIDRHKYIQAQKGIVSGTQEFGNGTLKIEKGPPYITVTTDQKGEETLTKNEGVVKGGGGTTYYGVVFFLSSVVAATCLFAVACIYEYKRILLGKLRRTCTFMMNVCVKCSCSPHHKACEDDGYCSYYRSTDNLIDSNRHFIHFMRSLNEPNQYLPIPDPDDCYLCKQYTRECMTCSSVDLQNTTEPVETTSHPTVYFDKETENVSITMPSRTTKSHHSQVCGCECNSGLLQSVDNGYAKTDYGLPATIDVEQVTDSDSDNLKTSCVGNLSRILIKGKKQNGKNPNPRHVTFPPLPDLEVVHEFQKGT